MRVIAGSAKGTSLKVVPGTGTRPISDRVKEAIFNILGPRIAGASVLDLFAGTGSVGIEALSRGAARAVFVEKSSKATGIIHANLQATRLHSRAEIVRNDVFKYLASAPQSFDVVYIAPPQYQELWSKTLLALDANPGWLAPEGTAFVQIFPKEFDPLALQTLHLVDQRKYGSTLVCLYEPQTEN